MGSQQELEDFSATVPEVSAEVDLGSLTLSPAEGYLLSRIDGITPCGMLRELGGLAPLEADACMRRWLEAGVLRPVGDKPETPLVDETPPPSNDTVELPGDPMADAIEAGLELPEEQQRDILEFEKKLNEPYHVILGVSHDADGRTIKRAYFKLSKRFHPDRYFRKEIGSFAERVERVFRKIAEAYELLSDPSARAEVERSLGGEAAEADPEDTGEAPVTPGPRRRGKPHAFSLVARIQSQRRKKARDYFDRGMEAAEHEKWVDAAGSMRLAIAYDPTAEDFKEPFSQAVRHANEIRAAKHMREGDSAFQLGEYATAYRSYAEGLHYRPFDAEVNDRAAKLAWRVEGDLKAAKEFASVACEVNPDVAQYRKTLGQVYAAAELYVNAKRELEKALRLDPKDEEIKQELKAIKREARSPSPRGES